MLHVIAVDDEVAALNRFERVASTNPNIVIEGRFQYPEDAIAFVKAHSVDVAFLDIEMPEMSGLELAEELMEIKPYINVVFITAYDQYALNAFRAHAIGYLLKPLDNDEFTEQIDHLMCTCSQRPMENPKRLLHVTCFGQFSVRPPEVSSSAIRWKTAKAEELFALLIYYQSRSRSKGILIDTLWPELEPQKAANLFRVTCTYLRSALSEIGFSNMLIRELEEYKINTSLIDCDLFRFINVIHSHQPENLENIKEASALYSGEFLEGKAYNWTSRARAELESDFKKLQFSLADNYLESGCINKAYQALDKILNHDPCDEEVVTRIIQMKLQNTEAASAIKVFREYRSILKKEFGVLPSKDIQALFSKYLD